MLSVASNTSRSSTHAEQDSRPLSLDSSLPLRAIYVSLPLTGDRSELKSTASESETSQSLSTYLTSDASITDATREPPQRDLQPTSQVKHSDNCQSRRTTLANQLFELREAEHQHLHTLRSIS